MNDSLLSVSGLNKSYRKRQVLFDNSFTIEKEEIVGIVGPNGAGKTTLFKVILGLIPSDSGEILACGISQNQCFPKYMNNLTGFVEEPAFYDHLSAYKNLRLRARACRNVSNKKIMEALSFVGLQGKEKDKVKTFSMGMKQRLNIALCLMSNASVIFMDEPLNGIDPTGIIQMRKLFCDIAKEKHISIVLSSHMLNELSQICDRVVFISEGKLVRTVNMGELRGELSNQIIYVVDPIEKALAVLREKKPMLSIHLESDKNIFRVCENDDSYSQTEIIKLLSDNEIKILDIHNDKVDMERMYLETTKEDGEQ